MASTGSIVYLRPRLVEAETPNRQTGSALYIPFRDLSGIFSSGAGVSSNNNSTSAKAMYPGPRVQMVDEKGFITTPWDRFFRWILNDKLGGVSAPSITDVASTIISVQEAVTTTVSTVTGLSDQASANAQVLDTVKEVVQNNSLGGASQIPEVSRSTMNNL